MWHQYKPNNKSVSNSNGKQTAQKNENKRVKLSVFSRSVLDFLDQLSL